MRLLQTTARSCLLLCVPVLAAQTPVSSETSIGVWPWLVGNIDAYQDEIIGKARSTGLDTIYVSLWRTLGSRSGRLHIVDEAGSWNAADGQLVPQVTLRRFIDKAHTAGIQVVGVIKVFDSAVPASDYAHQDHVIQKVIRYLVHSYDAQGQPVYPLDGIALDYIRWFGGNHTSREVNRFLDEARREVGVLPLHAYVIASPYALDAGSYDNRFRSYSALRSYLIANYGQDWEQMAARIDYLMPMTYIANGGVYGANLAYMEGYARQAASYARAAVAAARSRCRVVSAVRTWNSTGQTTTQATVEASCRGAMQGGADGFMAFRYFTARGQNSWFQGLARYAVPGQDLPIGSLGGLATGAEFRLDSSRTSHGKYTWQQLVVDIDLDGDGRFETGPLPPGPFLLLLKGVFRRVVTLRVTDPAGRRDYARLRVDPAAWFTGTAASLSAAAGGSIGLRLAPGPTQGGQRYIVFASASGTAPGTPLGGGLTVPLNLDALTVAVLGVGNTVMFQGFQGALDGRGTATAVFRVPQNVIPANLVGRSVQFAAVGIDSRTLQPIYASNPWTIGIRP